MKVIDYGSAKKKKKKKWAKLNTRKFMCEKNEHVQNGICVNCVLHFLHYHVSRGVM